MSDTAGDSERFGRVAERDRSIAAASAGCV